MSLNENQNESARAENAKSALADLGAEATAPKKRGRKPKARSAAKPKKEANSPAKRVPKPGPKSSKKKPGPKPAAKKAGKKRGRKPKSESSAPAAVEQPWPGFIAWALIGLHAKLGLAVKAWSEWQGRRALRQSEKLVARARAMDSLARALVA